MVWTLRWLALGARVLHHLKITQRKNINHHIVLVLTLSITDGVWFLTVSPLRYIKIHWKSIKYLRSILKVETQYLESVFIFIYRDFHSYNKFFFEKFKNSGYFFITSHIYILLYNWWVSTDSYLTLFKKIRPIFYCYSSQNIDREYWKIYDLTYISFCKNYI